MEPQVSGDGTGKIQLGRGFSSITAYELCSRVLDATDNDAGALMALASWQETSWLEFKAACGPPLGEAPKATFNLHDYRWNVAEAVIALSNTHGGCILLGIDDRAEAVGLDACDPKMLLANKGVDDFFRYMDSAVLRPSEGWSCANAGKIVLDGDVPHNLCELRLGKLDEEEVVCILVPPRPEAAICSQCRISHLNHCIHCIENPEGKTREFVPVRKLGNLGSITRFYLSRDWLKWEKERQTSHAHYSELLQKFQRGRNSKCLNLSSGGAMKGFWRGTYKENKVDHPFAITINWEANSDCLKRLEFKGFAREPSPDWAPDDFEFLHSEIDGAFEYDEERVHFTKRYSSGNMKHALTYSGRLCEPNLFEGTWESNRKILRNSGSFQLKRLRPYKILVTGFEGLGRHEVNSSWEVASEVEKRADHLLPHRLHVHKLAVDYRVARTQLESLMRDHTPDLCLCLGMSPSNKQCCVKVEARKPKQFRDQPGPGRLLGTWPTGELEQAFASAGLPVEVSKDAGRYVCESTYWSLLAFQSQTGYPSCSGFLHLPDIKNCNYSRAKRPFFLEITHF